MWAGPVLRWKVERLQLESRVSKCLGRKWNLVSRQVDEVNTDLR